MPQEIVPKFSQIDPSEPIKETTDDEVVVSSKHKKKV